MSLTIVPDFSGDGRFDAGSATEPGAAGTPLGDGVRQIGDFTLDEEIARGGMGVVYRAHQVSLNRTVALKLMRSGQLATDAEVERFRAEAEAAANLDHPNIVPIYEVGEYEGRHYFTMKLIEGGNLAQRMSQFTNDHRAAAALVAEIARAVAVGHRHGVLHRDLKPSNILLDESGKPYVSDFGLAKRMEDQSLTYSQAVVGTPSYMAPEQAAGQTKRVTVASDVYGLGSILYHMLTGSPPFQSDSVLETLRLVQEAEPVSVRKLNPRVDLDLETITLKCLAKDPSQRYEAAHDLADDLEAWLGGRSIRARRVAAPERLWRWCRRKPALAGMSALIVLLVLSLAIGSTIAAAMLLRAQRDATVRLRESFEAEAQATRWSRREGQRFHALEALARAAAIEPNVKQRNEAVAAMALADVRSAWRHARAVTEHNTFIFDPDFERFIEGTSDGTIVIRSRHTRQVLRTLPGEGVRAVMLRVSGDGRRLAVKYHNYISDVRVLVKVWNLDNGECLLTIPNGVWAAAMDISRDGRLLATGRSDGAIHLTDLESGEDTVIAFGHPPRGLAISADGTRVAAGTLDAKRLTVWRTGDGGLVREFDPPSNVFAMAWDAAGERLAAVSTDRKGYVYDSSTGEQLLVLEGHDAEVTFVAFDPMGDMIATSSWDSTTRLWSARTGRLLVTASGATNGFHQDGRRLSYITNDEFGEWEVAGGDECRDLLTPWGGKVAASLDVSPDGRLFTVTGGAGVVVCDVLTQQVVATLDVPHAYRAQFHPEGGFLFTSGYRGLQQWPIRREPSAQGESLVIEPPKLLASYRGLGYGNLRRDGRWFAAVHGDHLHVIDLDAADPPPRTVQVKPGLERLSYSPDGTWIAVGSWHGTGVHLIDASSGELVRTLLPDFPNVRSGFSPDGRSLVASHGTHVSILRTGTWERTHQFERQGKSGQPGCFAFSGEHGLLANTTDVGTIELRDAGTLELLCRLESPVSLGINHLAFTPDERFLIAVLQDHLVQVWDLHLIRHRLREMGLGWDEHILPAPPVHAPIDPVNVVIESAP